MGRGSDKTLTIRLLSNARRLWSSPKVKIGLIASFTLLVFIYLFSGSSSSNTNDMSISNKPIYSESQSNSQKRIACLLITDSKIIESSKRKEKYLDSIAGIFMVLKVYDKYLSPYCDIKIFMVNNSMNGFPYTDAEIQLRLPNSVVVFIPRNTEEFDRKDRLYAYHMISYAYEYFTHYEWYLKISTPLNKLLIVDHFEKLVYDESGQSVYNMNKPKLIGHAIKDTCADFIYSKAVYAFNQQFVLIIGKLASQNIKDEKIHLDHEIHCKSHGLCGRHSQDDFTGFCLTDLGVNIEPTRDSNNREYFLIYSIREHYVRMNKWIKGDWYWRGKDRKAVGKQCCANYPIAFGHYSDFEDLEIAYEKVYSVTPQERNMKFLSTITYFDNSIKKLKRVDKQPHRNDKNDKKK